MLNAGDIVFMRQSQDEIYTLRERPIDVVFIDTVYDDFTGEVIDEAETSISVLAVITEISTRSKDGSRFVQDGIEYEQGDVKVDIKLEYIDGLINEIIRAEFNGKKYELLGGDLKGIGERNRIEYVGRVIA